MQNCPDQSKFTNLHIKHTAELFQFVGNGTVYHNVVRFPTALDRTVHHILGVAVGFDYHRGAVELLGFVQRRAFRNEEAEAAVRFAAYPEQGDLLTGFAAEIHDRADFAVGVYAYLGTGILPGQVAGCHAAGGCRR